MAAGGSDLSWQQQHPDGGTIFPNGAGARDGNAGKSVPAITLAVEHYNRMIRVVDKGVPVKVELNVETKFYDESTPNGFNTIADIPGGDLASEIVMLGAHFDSHPYATGATDNATGSAAMMEAMRILKAVGAKPRRTIRIALWGGEEQGLLGSRAYVRTHIAEVETMTLKPEHAKLSAYFNSDNGSGKVRGIWLQGNMAARPIFEGWMAPLKDLGVSIIGPRSVTSTDHLSFDNAGIPAFQFLVNRLEYNSRTHHSNMDTFDRVQREDMVQQAAVIAVFAYNAAMRQEKLPRKALPAAQRARLVAEQSELMDRSLGCLPRDSSRGKPRAPASCQSSRSASLLDERRSAQGFGNRIGSDGSAVNMHRALCPQSETVASLCCAPYFSETYFANASPRARRVGPCAIAGHDASKPPSGRMSISPTM
jgi:peptidase M28-like protein